LFTKVNYIQEGRKKEVAFFPLKKMVLVLENSPLDYESGNRQGNPADQFLTSSDVQMKGKM